MTCPKCKKPFKPWSFCKDRRLAKLCPNCSILALAWFMEMPMPGDTLKDISDGEQLGAELRKIAE